MVDKNDMLLLAALGLAISCGSCVRPPMVKAGEPQRVIFTLVGRERTITALTSENGPCYFAGRSGKAGLVRDSVRNAYTLDELRGRNPEMHNQIESSWAGEAWGDLGDAEN